MSKEIIDDKKKYELSVEEDMKRLQEINQINDDYIKSVKKQKILTPKDIEVLDKISTTIIKRALLIADMEEKNNSWSKLSVKINI